MDFMVTILELLCFIYCFKNKRNHVKQANINITMLLKKHKSFYRLYMIKDETNFYLKRICIQKKIINNTISL